MSPPPREIDTVTLLSTQNRSLLADAKGVWRPLSFLLAPLAVVAALYATTTRSYVQSWNDYDSLGNTHGWLILAVVIWLLYNQSKVERDIAIRPAFWSAALLATLSVLWFLLVRVNIQTGHQMLLPVVLLVGYAALFGPAVARRCVFPIGYLYFAIPFWGGINGILQWGTVFAVRILLRVVGIPAYFQSNELHLPAGVLAVEGGCSGLHFFVVAMAIATLYWRLTAMKRPVVLFVLAASLAILSNWLRVFAIAVAGYLTNMQHYLVRVEHYRFGWVVFAMGMAGFFFIAGRMDGTARPQPPLSPAGVDTLKSNPQWVVIVVLALAVGPVAHWGLKLRDQNTALDRETLAAPSGWSIAPEPASTWQPKFANADFSDVTRYARTATTIEVFRAKYVDQRQDKKLAGYGNSVLGAGYQDEADESAAQVLPGFSRTIMRDFKGRKWLVLHTYYVGQRAFASPVPAQVFYGISSIFTPEPVGVLAARSECAPNCDAAAALLSDFIRVLPSDLRLSPASAGKSAE